MAVIQAGLIYFGIIPAFGLVPGDLRTMLLVPLPGPVAAIALEVPGMLVLSWLVCGAVLR